MKAVKTQKREVHRKWEYFTEAERRSRSMVTHERDADYGYTVKYLNGIPISFTKDHG